MPTINEARLLLLLTRSDAFNFSATNKKPEQLSSHSLVLMRLIGSWHKIRLIKVMTKHLAASQLIEA